MKRRWIVAGLLAVLLLGILVWHIPTFSIFFVSRRLGIDPSFEAMQRYIEEQTAVGRTKPEVFAAIEKIDPDAPVWRVASAPGSECYEVDLYPTFKTFGLSRGICFDREGKVISSEFRDS